MKPSTPAREIAYEALMACKGTEEVWAKSYLWRLAQEWQLLADTEVSQGEEEIKVSRDLIRMLSR